MQTYRATVQYDGTDYAGFQRQSLRRSIQGELESTILAITGQSVVVTGAGRTDAGVHARGQVISFRSESDLGIDVLSKAINARLPRDIALTELAVTDNDFNARFAAKTRVYEYLVHQGKAPSPFLRRFTYHSWGRMLDVDAMNTAFRYLIGTHDFTSFGNAIRRNREDDVVEFGTTVRHVVKARCRVRASLVYFYIEANGFLSHMVRLIVGTLLQVGRHDLVPDDVIRIHKAQDIRTCGPAVPSHGLHLLRVTY